MPAVPPLKAVDNLPHDNQHTRHSMLKRIDTIFDVLETFKNAWFPSGEGGNEQTSFRDFLKCLVPKPIDFTS